MPQDYIYLETGEILENMASHTDAVERFQHYEVNVVSPDDVITLEAFKKVEAVIKTEMAVKVSSSIW